LTRKYYLHYKYVMQDLKVSEIGKLLKKYRLEREWSLDQLSKITRISTSALWYIEQGEKQPNDLTKHKLEKSLPGLFETAV
jgi:transcriptional regulator with XRE-family HTH domain